MTGIERLRDIAEDRYSGGMVHISVHKLREICEQIEREVADISGHESEVLAFVEEKGGLDELERRLMPEGMVWPRFEDGELVGFGDEYVNAKGNVSTLRTIVIKDCRDRLGGGYYWKLGKGACAVVVKNGKRIKRPPVIAADGKPLEVGQSVWGEVGTEFAVKSINHKLKQFTAIRKYDGCECSGLNPMIFTHQRPVLDADGVPIHEGDTVWHVSGGKAAEVAYTIAADASHPDEVVLKGYEDDWPMNADQLTHTKPDPDTWERIEHDAKVIDEMIESEWGGDPTDARDLVRRCKALAERDR